MKKFAARFFELLAEDSFAGAGGAFGDAPSMSHGGDVPGGSDFYAPGDARLPYAVGAFKRSGKIKKRKRKLSKRK